MLAIPGLDVSKEEEEEAKQQILLLYRVIHDECQLLYFSTPILTLTTEWYVIRLPRNSKLTFQKKIRKNGYQTRAGYIP